jgi:glycosyltransferase involved in cell wall biosynthesis
LSLRQTAGTSRGCAVRTVPSLPGATILPRQQATPDRAAADGDALESGHDGPGYGASIKLSVLMAVFNEERTIKRVIDEVLNTPCPCPLELIVVDDGSTDGTSALLAQVSDPRVTVFQHEDNQGKGAAIRNGLSLATGTYILPFDADLEYEPDDIPRMLEPVLKGRCEVVYGARLFGYNTVYQSYLYAVGNRLLTRMANVLFNAHLTDLHTCLKLVPHEMLNRLELAEKGFGLDTEITAGLLRLGVRPFEIPVSYYGRSHAQGKKIKWGDAVACALILTKMRFRSRPRWVSNPDASEDECAGVAVAEPTEAVAG